MSNRKIRKSLAHAVRNWSWAKFDHYVRSQERRRNARMSIDITRGPDGWHYIWDRKDPFKLLGTLEHTGGLGYRARAVYGGEKVLEYDKALAYLCGCYKRGKRT